MVDGEEETQELSHWEYKQLYDHLIDIGLSKHNAGRAIALFGITAKSYSIGQLEDLLSATTQYLRSGSQEEIFPTRTNTNAKAEPEITHEPSQKKKLLIPKKPSKQSLTNALLNIKKKQETEISKPQPTKEKEDFNPKNFMAGNINYDF